MASGAGSVVQPACRFSPARGTQRRPAQILLASRALGSIARGLALSGGLGHVRRRERDVGRQEEAVAVLYEQADDGGGVHKVLEVGECLALRAQEVGGEHVGHRANTHAVVLLLGTDTAEEAAESVQHRGVRRREGGDDRAHVCKQHIERRSSMLLSHLHKHLVTRVRAHGVWELAEEELEQRRRHVRVPPAGAQVVEHALEVARVEAVPEVAHAPVLCRHSKDAVGAQHGRAEDVFTEGEEHAGHAAVAAVAFEHRLVEGQAEAALRGRCSRPLGLGSPTLARAGGNERLTTVCASCSTL
mmetsp:Transcript_23939/g.74536  ORF Transcript_23939/g.74536 Transcript_23939/m.74536 type:complete len:301 (-) Transcript_23939:380-1282(-)